MTNEEMIIDKLEKLGASVQDIKVHLGTLATKDELWQVKSEVMDIQNKLEGMATKEDLRQTESRLMNHIDGFAKAQEKFDVELVAMGSRLNRLEGRA